MSQEEYDEFGNLIGDPFDSDAESSDNSIISQEAFSDGENESESDEAERVNNKRKHIDDNQSTSTDTNEDQDVAENQGSSNVTDLITRDDTRPTVPITYVKDQTFSGPVIQPVDEKKIRFELNHNNQEDVLPQLKYSYEYLANLNNQVPSRIRNLAVVGNMHSGKTSFLDSLIHETYAQPPNHDSPDKPTRILDNHKLEVERGISIKVSPVTLLLPDLKEKSHILNLIDTPGHFNFFNESQAPLNHTEGVILVIDVVEGFTPRDKQIVSDVLSRNKEIILVLNKIDRLILELNLPVTDSYYKLKYIIDDINIFIASSEYYSKNTHKLLSPSNNNVIFASGLLGLNFSLLSFAKLYLDTNNIEIDHISFAKKLWTHDYDEAKNALTKPVKSSQLPSAFESFILDPIYKIITYTLTSSLHDDRLEKLLLAHFNVKLRKAQYKQDHKPLLRDIFKTIFRGYGGVVEAAKEVSHPISTPQEKTLFGKIINLIESPDTSKFYALVRVQSGSISSGQKIKVVGENFLEDEENYTVETIEEIFIPYGRYKVPTNEAGAGSIVIVSGIDSIITKNGTIVAETFPIASITQKHVSNNLAQLYEKSVFKVAIEPANPSELPKLLQGIRRVNKSYISSNINVEESGEIVLYGPGEIYLDCILHDLRYYFTNDLEIKVSDPMTRFNETCIDTSAAKIGISTKSGNNSISVVAEPQNDDRLSEFIESGKLDLSQPVRTTSKILRSEFGWDALAARSVWNFGPDDLKNPNILMDDTLEAETDKKLLYSVKDSIGLGFKWSVNEGPLCNEPIRRTKFKILDAIISGSEIQRSSTQIIPMTRKACYTGFLTATPRLLEPIYTIYITCTEQCRPVISKLLKPRRGYLEKQKPIPATPLFEMEAVVPVIESIGLESDIRLHTQGQAMCFFDFSRWDIVPGDPLDQNCYLPTLKPVPTESLARDFVLKTRRRKGLTGEITLQKYVDPELYDKLKDSGVL